MTPSKAVPAEANFDLKPYNTFKISSIAKVAYFPNTTEEFIELLKMFKNGETPIILGAGSNVLLSSEGIKKPVILTNKLNKIELNGEIITAQAGVKTGVLSKFALKNKLSGFEFLTPIPASIGGAVCMNASAHNQAISDTFLSAKLFDFKTKKIVEFNKKEMRFAYRKSILQAETGSGLVFLEGKFKLEHANPQEIETKMEQNLAVRKAHQPPLSLPNAGSIFKNPENAAAGALIEKTGLKGKKISGAQIYQNHANFIINNGGATSSNILELMFLAYNRVKEEFKIELKPEIIFIGEKADKDCEIVEELWKTAKKQI